MPTSTSMLEFAVVVAAYATVLFAPGALVGALAGARGWLLAGVAPLLTYAVAGLAGPWLALAGLPFNLPWFLAAVALAACAALLLRRRVRRHGRGGSPWPRPAHGAVLVCLLFAAGVGAYTIVRGMGSFGAIAQGFDAVYHANGIRYVADTGDGSLTGTSSVNWYADGTELFYPNAYHLLGSLVYRLTGADIPVVLNAGTVLLPGLLALAMVVLVRHFAGRAMLAGTAALVSVAPVTVLYESLDHGPLLPFLLGLALSFVGVVTLHAFLARPGPDTGFVLAGAVLGLLTVHTSTLFTAVLFALPLLVARWVSGRDWRRVRRDVLVLLPVAAACLVLAWQQLFGALGLAAGSEYAYQGWPSKTEWNTAFGILLTFQHFERQPQLWLTAALLVGCVCARSLGRLRWVAGTAAATGLFAVAVIASDSPLVMALSRPWWDDPYRLIAMAGVPMSLLAAHGIAETQRRVRDALARLPRLPASPAAWGTAVVVVVAFVFATNLLYSRADADVVRPGFGPRPGVPERQLPVSRGEAAAMLRLGELAQPGDWVMNARNDGTAWAYALSGVRVVSGHFDRGLQPPEAVFLVNHFNEYGTSERVRETVQRMNIRWVITGRGGYPRGAPRPQGLKHLDRMPFLELVYRNADASLYRLAPGSAVP